MFQKNEKIWKKFEKEESKKIETRKKEDENKEIKMKKYTKLKQI